MAWRPEQRAAWHRAGSFQPVDATKVMEQHREISQHILDSLASHVRLVREFVRAQPVQDQWYAIARLLSVTSADGIASFIAQRMPEPKVLSVTKFSEVQKLAATTPDARSANVEGTYHVFTAFKRSGRQRYGSFTGVAAEQVVAERVRAVVQGFSAANASVVLTDPLYQPKTSEVVYLLTTVAPNTEVKAIKKLFRQCTGVKFPGNVMDVAHLVAAMDELVLCSFFGDLHQGFPADDEPLSIARDFFPLNSIPPAGAPAVMSENAASQAALRRQHEVERIDRIKSMENESEDLNVRGMWEGIPVKVDLQGHLRIKIMQHDFCCPLPGQWSAGEAQLKLAEADPPSRKMPLPLSAPHTASSLLDSYDLFVGDWPIDFAGVALDDDVNKDWASLLDALEWCRTKPSGKENNREQYHKGLVARLLSRQGARFRTSNGVLVLPALASATAATYRDRLLEEWPSGEWILPCEMQAKDDVDVLLRVDCNAVPYHLHYTCRAPLDANIPAIWQTLKVDPPQARALVNLARMDLGLPPRLPVQPSVPAEAVRGKSGNAVSRPREPASEDPARPHRRQKQE
ncbi:unnamed protein product [Parajaminaea phylloscopi]